MHYDLIKELIAKNQDICEFAPFGEGTSDIWIKKAEDRLGIKLPPSYIWWLKNYGCGEINGEEIFSLYEISSDLDSILRGDVATPAGDIIYRNELDRKDNISCKNQLIIQTNDQGEYYYFDLLQPDIIGEYPVYVGMGIPLSGIKYADNFLEFLQKKIQE